MTAQMADVTIVWMWLAITIAFTALVAREMRKRQHQ